MSEFCKVEHLPRTTLRLEAVSDLQSEICQLSLHSRRSARSEAVGNGRQVELRLVNVVVSRSS